MMENNIETARDFVLERHKEARQYLTDGHFTYENMVAYADKFIPKWISVDDDTPDWFNHKGVVIVYMPNAYTKIDCQGVYNNGRGGSCFHTGWNKGEGQFEVTHWQPIPTPPLH